MSNVLNLIGSGEPAIWEVDEVLDLLLLAGAFGAPTGSPFPSTAGSTPAACLLKLDDRVVGAIDIFSLLQQKSRLEPVDRELLDLFALPPETWQ